MQVYRYPTCCRPLIVAASRRSRVWLASALCAGAIACSVGGVNANGDDRPNTEQIAARLQQVTVTLRIAAPAANDAAETSTARTESITVTSGVGLSHGAIITFARVPLDARCRATLPDGEQAEARLRVVDEYSGLSLLQIEHDLPGLDLASEPPALGAAVVTAAAAGIEQPTVSLGIVAGTDRSLAGTGLPPLLQCDLRTTDSSSGAAVVDSHGRLVGVIAGMMVAPEQRGWTYAVPAAHVQRLVRAQDKSDSDVVVLRQQRPSVGLTLGPSEKEGMVRVDRLAPGGPAEQAGIRQGDLVLRADGRRIRSAYQAVSLILKKQPGDAVDFLIERDGRQQTVAVTLGGSQASGTVQVGPQLMVRANGRQIEVQNGARVAELAGQPQPDRSAAVPPAARIARDEASLLRAQIDAFAKVIERLQAELDRRETAQRDTNALIKSLTDEVTRLREQLDAANAKREP